MKIKTSVKSHTIGMIIIGAVVWGFYLAYANILTIVFGVNHLVAEISGIPLSWVMNYALNTRFNFGLPFTIKRFVTFCLISGGGWIFYALTTYICTDILGWYSLIGTLVGVGTKTVSNIVLQQAITFGKMAINEKDGVEPSKKTRPDYDWNAYYKGNFIQRYWKHKIADYTISMVTSNPILDVGCGSSPLLSRIPAQIKCGIDIDKIKIGFMQQRDTTSYYSIYDGKQLPYEDKKFETVICNEVIEHHLRPNELIRELSRVTKNGGTVIIATPDYASIKWNIIEVLYGILMNTGYELEHGSKFTETGLVALGNAYGLEHVKTERVLGCDMVCQFIKQ